MLITCSSCQAKIRVPDAAAGKKGKCPKCGTIIVIPTAEEAAAEEAASPPEPAPPAQAPGAASFDFASEPPPKKRRQRDDEEEAVADADEEVLDDEGEDRLRKKVRAPESIGLSVTSLVLGIVSLFSAGGGFCCCFFAPVSLLCAIGALITGFLGMNKGGKVMAIVGMSLGGLSLLLAIGGIVLGFLLGGLNVLLGGAQQFQMKKF